ncbi:MAG TPA: diacylglycerol kinase family protein [Gemmatimonadaceae bacterium]|nr:diacylglycerol kinase family protein [Gemmatimonadaceae bacterium]
MLDTTCLIVNPAAGRGRIHASLPALRAAFSARGINTTYETSGPGQEEALAERAIRAGNRTIIAVGGDGTCGQIANAILRSGVSCRLAVVAGGTGNDFAKTLGVTNHTPEQVADLVVHGQSTQMDVGLVDGRYFINSCGFGFDASVLDASNRIRFIKGNAVYIYSALTQLFTYRGAEVSVTGVPAVKHGQMLMVTVSIGRYLGGAFKIAPHASVLDGKLDVCFLRDANVMQRLKLFLGAMRGTHIGLPSVSTAAVEKIALTFPCNPSMELDGELRVAKSRTVELQCIPRALSVVAAPGAIV